MPYPFQLLSCLFCLPISFVLSSFFLEASRGPLSKSMALPTSQSIWEEFELTSESSEILGHPTVINAVEIVSLNLVLV